MNGRTSPDSSGLRSQAVMVKVEDVDTHHQHARQRGVQILSPPAD